MRRGQETLDAIEQNDATLTKLLISDRGCGLNHRHSNDSEEVGEYDPTTSSLGSGNQLERLGRAIGSNTHLTTLELYWNQDLVDVFNDDRHGLFFEGLKHNRSIRRLNLEHCNLLHGEPARKVLEVIGENIGLLTTLQIHGRCILGDEGMQLLASTLRKCTNLESVFFRSNSFIAHDNYFLDIFVPIMKQLPHLKELDLGGDSIGWLGCLELVDLLQDSDNCCNIQTLGLATNNIDDDCAILLAYALKDNDKLQHLDLCCNNIGDDGATALSFGLSEKNVLQNIYLDVNPITDKGWCAFHVAVCNSASINDTYSSNHSLQRLTKDPTRKFPGTLNHWMRQNRSMDKKQVARKKILLQHENIDMEPFFEWELKVLPRVIDWYDTIRPCIPTTYEATFKARVLAAMYQFIRAFPGSVEGLEAWLTSAVQRTFINNE